MEELLFLAHRLPYPPNKGDKIRSYHLLKHLARDHKVYLAAFVDDPADWKHVEHLRSCCEDVYVRPLRPRWAKLKSLRGLLSGEALTLSYYYDPVLANHVEQWLERRPISRVVAFSSSMAQYLPSNRQSSTRCLMDFVDVDSQKWLQYSDRQRWPMSWLYRREARYLGDYERHVAQVWDLSVFVTEEEATLFRGLAPEAAPRVHSLENGVDLAYFDPSGDFDCPFPGDKSAMVFTGAMDYWANVDAVKWFVEQVWPTVRENIPNAEFYIVGARPTQEVLALQDTAGVHVTGAVHDIRPYLAHACFAVAPLRIARGVQNKVLEALAMSQPVVMTSGAAEGIPLGEVPFARVVDAPGDVAEACMDWLRNPVTAQLRGEARTWVSSRYNWESKFGMLDRWFSLGGRHDAGAGPSGESA